MANERTPFLKYVHLMLKQMWPEIILHDEQYPDFRNYPDTIEELVVLLSPLEYQLANNNFEDESIKIYELLKHDPDIELVYH